MLQKLRRGFIVPEKGYWYLSIAGNLSRQICSYNICFVFLSIQCINQCYEVSYLSVYILLWLSELSKGPLHNLVTTARLACRSFALVISIPWISETRSSCLLSQSLIHKNIEAVSITWLINRVVFRSPWRLFWLWYIAQWGSLSFWTKYEVGFGGFDGHLLQIEGLQALEAASVRKQVDDAMDTSWVVDICKNKSERLLMAIFESCLFL